MGAAPGSVEFRKFEIRQNKDPRNISAIRYRGHKYRSYIHSHQCHSLGAEYLVIGEDREEGEVD